MTDKAQGAAGCYSPTNDEVYAEVCRERGKASLYVSSNAVNDVMAAVRALTIRAALKAKPAPTEAQGEDSARVDAERYRYLRDTGTLDTAIWEALEGYGMTNEAGELDQAAYARSMDIAIDRARASAETGGVKS